ncbi:MAG: cupin domain-containing protein [Acidimicrobiia bacterium]|nr:cupin domain-containing protein [Acidimicrobiia bacterium]
MKHEREELSTHVPSGHGIPRVFTIRDLVPRANSPQSRSARVVNEETTGAKNLFAGVFWSDPGASGGWSFGSADPGVPGCPHVGVGEEVYLCIRGRVAVEWEGGSFEFGAGDIVFWPNNRWFRTRVISDEPVQMFYVMAPPPTSMWGLGDPVSQTGESIR